MENLEKINEEEIKKVIEFKKSLEEKLKYEYNEKIKIFLKKIKNN